VALSIFGAEFPLVAGAGRLLMIEVAQTAKVMPMVIVAQILR